MRFRLKSGLSLRYRTRGAGRTILLLHPVGLRLEFWDALIDRLEGDFRLIAVDTTGHGESDVPQVPFSLDRLAEDMHEFCAVLAPDGVIPVGCSMGGMIVQGMAALGGAAKLKGLVIANTAHLRNDQGRAAMQKRADEAARGMPVVIDGTLERWFDVGVRQRQPALVALARAWLRDADPIVHSWSWMAIKDLSYAERLRQCTIPTIAIAALRDQSTPVSAVKAMADCFPAGGYREIDTGHLAPLEDPATFADLVRSFVKDIG